VKAAFLCLAHALVAMARISGDTKYKSHRNGYGLKQAVQDPLNASGVNLTNSGGLNEPEQFQNYLSEYKTIMYHDLSTDRVIFEANSLSNKKLYLL